MHSMPSQHLNPKHQIRSTKSETVLKPSNPKQKRRELVVHAAALSADRRAILFNPWRVLETSTG